MRSDYTTRKLWIIPSWISQEFFADGVDVVLFESFRIVKVVKGDDGDGRGKEEALSVRQGFDHISAKRHIVNDLRDRLSTREVLLSWYKAISHWRLIGSIRM